MYFLHNFKHYIVFAVFLFDKDCGCIRLYFIRLYFVFIIH